MHTNQTYNSLIIDNPNLPFPSDVLEAIKGIDWSNISWNTIGLPAFNSTFSLVGDQLYFEKDENDNVKLKKEEFTGQVLISGLIVPAELEEVFMVVFELSFCGGTLKGSELKELKKQPKKEYEEGFQKFQKDMERNHKRLNSWWFKYLYKPYFHLLKGITFTVVFLTEFLLKLFVSFVSLLLPIKL